MHMNPTFSVVIPVYNRSEFLAETLASVNAQTTPPYEILVIDDGSSEDEAETISRIVHEAGGKLVRQDNAGAGIARNRGGQEANGVYLVFLDSDDLMSPVALATYTHVITQTNASLIAASYSEFNDDSPLNQEVTTDLEVKMNRFDDYFASSHNHEIVLGAGMMVLRRDLFLNSGGFTDLRVNAEDHDLAVRLGEAPVFVQIVSPTMLMYRRHANSLTAETDKSRAGIEFLLKQEREGRFPGGQQRSVERRQILTRHVRPVSLACLQEGDRTGACQLYRATFGTHVRQGAWKYLLGFPLLWLKSLFK